MIRKLLLLLALLAPASAHAQWREATSRNFIVYSAGREDELRATTEKLEKFDFVLRALHNIEQSAEPRRLKVYLMRNMEEVRATFPYSVGGVAGYYQNEARGAMLVTPRIGGRSDRDLSAETVLFHEYAHHFMYQYFPASYPSWYSEGFAEFYGGTRIEDDDVVTVGIPARHRFRSFAGNRWMPISRLLTARRYADAGYDLDLLYAQGWLLVHYLFANEERSGQLGAYLNGINAGKSYRQAMEDAFGPGARALNRELRNYSGRSRIDGMRLPFRRIEVGRIDVREMSPAESALVIQDIQLGQGVLARYAGNLAATVERVARRHPGDVRAQVLLAEAQRAADDHGGAMTTAERILSLEPDNADGLLMRGALRAAALRTAGSEEAAAWQAARADILAADRVRPNDPMILEAYYDSFAGEAALPPPAAQNALFTAMELAPGDDNIRYKVAADFERRGMVEDAKRAIRPAAYRMAHDGEESERERRRREQREERWRRVGDRPAETAREMYERLAAQTGEVLEEPVDEE